MGLQRFKLNIANTVINEENSGAGLQNMGGDEILGLFKQDQVKSSGADSQSTSAKRKIDSLTSGVAGLSADIVSELDKLTQESQEQYESAFDFDSYLNKLQK